MSKRNPIRVTKANAFGIMVEAIRNLRRWELKNLKFHLKKKTRILCGEQSGLYLKDGGG